ncbi:MAG: hypothetical protein M1834_009113 [Cirrosporium novae-zelandiae]|nr:MAG: hypothetical protein M1834_009113 [Cirrosporium novae-zelandiae]
MAPILSTFKNLLPLLALTTTTVLAETVAFETYYDTDCTQGIVTANVVLGYCVNIENFPMAAYTATVEDSSSGCDSGETLEIEIFEGTGCDESTTVIAEATVPQDCAAAVGTPQSIRLVCV